MKLDRKNGEDSAKTREAILDATETIMVEEGYPAATSRRVAEKAGLKSQLVHYYFATMEDLFVAVYERSEQTYIERLLSAANSENPLRAFWELSVHPQRTRLAQEFIALSNRRKSMQKITARVLEQMHAINSEFFAKYLQQRGFDLDAYPPIVLSHLISGLSRALVNEASVGVTQGHADVLAFAERWLGKLESAKLPEDF